MIYYIIVYTYNINYINLLFHIFSISIMNINSINIFLNSSK